VHNQKNCKKVKKTQKCECYFVGVFTDKNKNNLITNCVKQVLWLRDEKVWQIFRCFVVLRLRMILENILLSSFEWSNSAILFHLSAKTWQMNVLSVCLRRCIPLWKNYFLFTFWITLNSDKMHFSIFCRKMSQLKIKNFWKIFVKLKNRTFVNKVMYS
jgi:hypothetical protein